MRRKWWEGLIGSKKSEASKETAEERIRQAAETHAEALDLSSLGLAELPESLGQLTALQWLNLSNNQLSALPESLGQLAALQRLYLDRNQLGALPESLGRLNGYGSYIFTITRTSVCPPKYWAQHGKRFSSSSRKLLLNRSWTTTFAAGRRGRSTRQSSS